MKNKAMTYVLGISVLLVWGIIIYRIVDTVGEDDLPIGVASNNTNKEVYNDYALPADTGQLSLNYRDPFGLSKPKDTTVAVVKRDILVNNAKPSKPAFDWGFVRYSGYIRNPGSKKLLAIVSINGKTMMMAEGEKADGVQLVSNRQDSIKVTAGGKTTFIKIQQ